MYSEEPKKSHKGHNKRIICRIGTNANTEPENAQIVSFSRLCLSRSEHLNTCSAHNQGATNTSL